MPLASGNGNEDLSSVRTFNFTRGSADLLCRAHKCCSEAHQKSAMCFVNVKWVSDVLLAALQTRAVPFLHHAAFQAAGAGCLRTPTGHSLQRCMGLGQFVPWCDCRNNLSRTKQKRLM